MVLDSLRRVLRQLPSRMEGKTDGKYRQNSSTMTPTNTESHSVIIDDSSEGAPSKSSNSSERQSLLRATFPTLVVLTLVLISVVLGRQYVIDMLIYIDSLDWWESIVLFGVMFTMVAFPVMYGYVLLNIACGYTYGFMYGALMTFGCATYGIACAHFVMRKFCKSYVERTYVMSAQAKALMEVVSGRNGYKIVFLIRFTPIPFGLQNAIFAVSEIKTVPYLISSACGLSITQLAYAYMGSRFRSIAEVFSSDNSIATWVILSIQVVITILLMVFVIVLAKRELDKKVEPDSKPESTDISSPQSKGIQTVDCTDKLAPFSQSRTRSHSRNMSVNIPPIIASGVHIM